MCVEMFSNSCCIFVAGLVFSVLADSASAQVCDWPTIRDCSTRLSNISFVTDVQKCRSLSTDAKECLVGVLNQCTDHAVKEVIEGNIKELERDLRTNNCESTGSDRCKYETYMRCTSRIPANMSANQAIICPKLQWSVNCLHNELFFRCPEGSLKNTTEGVLASIKQLFAASCFHSPGASTTRYPPAGNWNNTTPGSSWNKTSPNNKWNWTTPNNKMNWTTPNNKWNWTTPNNKWNWTTPNNKWNWTTPNNKWNWTTPNNKWNWTTPGNTGNWTTTYHHRQLNTTSPYGGHSNCHQRDGNQCMWKTSDTQFYFQDRCREIASAKQCLIVLRERCRHNSTMLSWIDFKLWVNLDSLEEECKMRGHDTGPVIDTQNGKGNVVGDNDYASGSDPVTSPIAMTFAVTAILSTISAMMF